MSNETVFRVFLAFSPGLETHVQAEIADILFAFSAANVPTPLDSSITAPSPLPSSSNLSILTKRKGFKLENGGIELPVSIPELWSIIHFSRLIESARLRLCSPFRARHFDEFISGIEKIAWNAFVQRQFLPESSKALSKILKLPNTHSARSQFMTVAATCKSSALYHSGAVEERVMQSVFGRLSSHDPIKRQRKGLNAMHAHVLLKKLGQKSPFSHADDRDESEDVSTTTSPTSMAPNAPHVYVRLEQDQALLSLDVTGDLLHKRGYRTAIGEAPLRETLASACFAAAYADMIQRTSASNSSVIPQVWYDPFCGSGTIPLESHLFSNAMPSRLFPSSLPLPSFSTWPIHSEEKYHSFKQETAPRLSSLLRSIRSSHSTSNDVTKFCGSDIDHSVIAAANSNLQRAGVSMDLFSSKNAHELHHFVPKGSAVLTNLPYGHRIMSSSNSDDKKAASSSSSSSSLTRTLEKFGQALQKRPDLQHVYALDGTGGGHLLEKSTRMNWEAICSFKNGGLATRLVRLVR